jgi:peroxiredoxin
MNDNPQLTEKRGHLPALTGTLLAASIVGIAYLTVTGLSPSRSPQTRSEADDAKEYLRDKKVEPLSGPLQTLLADTSKPRVPTEKHALLGGPAPAFSVPDADDHLVSLESLLTRGPVVLVFYYGYSCNHCVAQLFALNDDLKYFRELGAIVVAIGPDTSERTRKKYAEFGAFGFPVLSDTNRTVASRYGVYRPKVEGTREWEAHGTFLIDRSGIIRWANTGDEPFIGNATLLAELARINGQAQTSSSPRSAKP